MKGRKGLFGDKIMNLLEAKKVVSEVFENAMVEGDPLSTADNCIFYMRDINARYHEYNDSIKRIKQEMKDLRGEVDWAENQRDEKAVGYYTALFMTKKDDFDAIIKVTERLDARIDALNVVAKHYLSEARRLEEASTSKPGVRVVKKSKTSRDRKRRIRVKI